MFFGIGLYHPTKEVNIGGVLRAAYCYDASFVVMTGRFAKQGSDTPNTTRHIPLFRGNDLFDLIPYDCAPVAVELLPQAVSLINYVHPPRAYYIFGPENSSLGKKVTSRCKDVIYIPTRTCMNLAATVNVVLYDRLSKS